MRTTHSDPATASSTSSAYADPRPQDAGPPGPQRPRIVSLDALRGFAIAGILPLNLVMILVTRGVVPAESLHSTPWLFFQIFVQSHFLPLFGLLFGLTFGMMWRSGRDRRHRPRAALARRMAFLVLVGLPHQVFAPGESLLVFGILGLLLLLPSTLLPRRLAAPLTATVGLAGVLAFFLGGPEVLLIGGLLLAGFAVGEAGFAGCWERPGAVRWLGAGAVVTGIGSGLGAYALLNSSESADWWTSVMHLTQLGMGTCYAVVLLLLMRTSAAGVLRAMFEPLGRCAMTCYISATLFITVIGEVLGSGALPLEAPTSWAIIAICVLAILVVQNLTMRWWLKHWARGPLETLSRKMTWWTRDGNPRLRETPKDAVDGGGAKTVGGRP